MKPQALQSYLSGRSKPGVVLQNKLRELNCNIEWLMTGKTSSGETEVLKTVPLMSVPVYAHVNAGTKTWVVSDEIVEYIAIPKSSDITQFGVIVKGNSMSPEINNGDVVILSEQAEVKNGDLCVVEFDDGEKNLRRILYDKNNVVLTSKNESEYPPVITQKNKIRKLYRVMKHIRNY